MPGARFLWAGEEDPVHPDSVDLNWFKSLEEVGYIGRLSDVAPLLAQADLLLFPSYREGVPRAVMEAAATGLPTIAFDVPGVREVVEEGRTGYLVPDI
ncbi:glycosyltransferase, partial [Pseudoalteromonas sp. GABNS16H]|uniref:glycosyltransferase n=1 Tax=Pseudoalteromonas sp. GABNS16H TaxID=3025325 RepID=UPI003FD4F56A